VEFAGVDDVQLGFFNHQNVINGLVVDETAEGRKLLIEPIYGLQGEFNFTSAQILKTERI
jgi:hypothetical protein